MLALGRFPTFVLLGLVATARASGQVSCDAEADGDCIINDVTLLQTTATLNAVEVPRTAAPGLLEQHSSSAKGFKADATKAEVRQAKRQAARMAKRRAVQHHDAKSQVAVDKRLFSGNGTDGTDVVDDEYSAAEATGVSSNVSGDLVALISADLTSLIAILVFVFIFKHLRERYPIMFNYNSVIGLVKDTPPNDYTSWMWASSEKEREEHVAVCGMDHAMLLEMCVFSMRVCAFIGLPMTFIMGPLCFWFGKGEASLTGDHLSMIGMNNVAIGHPWLWYVYGPIVCMVVWILKREVFRSMRTFCKYRHDWLKHLSDPEASTVLVEGIPEEYQQEEKVRDFFGKMFEPENVKDVHMVLYISELEGFFQDLELAKQNLASANQEWENKDKKPDARPKLSTLQATRLGGDVDAINHYTALVKRLEADVTQARADAWKQAKKEVGGVNSSTAFVQFSSRKHARSAMSVAFTADKNEWVLTAPSPPEDMIYSDLKVSEESKGTKRVLGYAMVFGLYVAFTPFCLWVTNVADSVNLGPLQSSWESYAPTLGLLIFLSFIPTVLINIFTVLFNYKSVINVQLQLQIWYFWFLFFFVILVTVVGQGFASFIAELAEDPLSLPVLLADSLPSSTHYYLNFLGAQWLTHGMNLIRYVQVFKFVGFSKIWEEKDAREMAEPEDQDYYGMGSRSARFTTNLLIVILLGTISPLMGFQGWVNFLVCRIIYGYLMVYSEAKKSDSGGVFFVSQMQHVWIGTIFYTFLMLGLFQSRAPDNVPACFGVAALIYACWSCRKFHHDFEWEHLPWADMVLDKEGSQLQRKDTGAQYIQQELQI